MDNKLVKWANDNYPPIDLNIQYKSVIELLKENQALRESNTRLKERIKMLEFNLNEVLTCYIACGKLLTGASKESIETTPIILKAKEALNNNNPK